MEQGECIRDQGNSMVITQQVPSESSSTNNGPTIKPQHFAGFEDWHIYLSHFEVCAELGRWNSREKALILMASLRGEAQSYCLTLHEDERRSYENITYKMEQRFGRAQPIWLKLFETRIRSEGEQIAKLGDDLRRLVQRAYPGFTHEAHETLALNQLYRSISPQIKFKCLMEQCDTIDKAVELIEIHEHIFDTVDSSEQSIQNSYSRHAYVQNEARENPSTNMHLEKVEKALDKLQDCINQLTHTAAKDNRRAQPIYQKRRLCYNCRSVNHLARNCPYMSSNPDRNDHETQDRQIPVHSHQVQRGLYTTGRIADTNFDMLIDNGSSNTLLAYRVYEQINSSVRPVLNQCDIGMADVTGSGIRVYGTAVVDINLGNTNFQQNVIVCDMVPDAILGQDFLLKYGKTVDYNSYTLETKSGNLIQCWLGHQDSMVCGVRITDAAVMPTYSSSRVPVLLSTEDRPHTGPHASLTGNEEHISHDSGGPDTEVTSTIELCNVSKVSRQRKPPDDSNRRKSKSMGCTVEKWHRIKRAKKQNVIKSRKLRDSIRRRKAMLNTSRTIKLCDPLVRSVRTMLCRKWMDLSIVSPYRDYLTLAVELSKNVASKILSLSETCHLGCDDTAE